MNKIKLGIAVVYLITKENQQLLELHLSQIKRCTSVPYTIYASTNRLLPDFQAYLAKQPEVKICNCLDTQLREADEHAYYLKYLVETAISDDCTHVVTLHVDSFPVRTDWVETLVGLISTDRPLATIAKNGFLIQYSACLFFRSDFYLKYRPPFLLSKAEKRTKIYRRFLAECPHQPVDSGVGFIFTAYIQRLNWIALDKGDYGDPERNIMGVISQKLGLIHGDLIFHLEGAFRYSENGTKSPSKRIAQLLIVVKELFKPVVPKWLKRCLEPLYKKLVIRPVYNEVRQQLLKDPERFIKRLRTGK